MHKRGKRNFIEEYLPNTKETFLAAFKSKGKLLLVTLNQKTDSMASMMFLHVTNAPPYDGTKNDPSKSFPPIEMNPALPPLCGHTFFRLRSVSKLLSCLTRLLDGILQVAPDWPKSHKRRRF